RHLGTSMDQQAPQLQRRARFQLGLTSPLQLLQSPRFAPEAPSAGPLVEWKHDARHQPGVGVASPSPGAADGGLQSHLAGSRDLELSSPPPLIPRQRGLQWRPLSRSKELALSLSKEPAPSLSKGWQG